MDPQAFAKNMIMKDIRMDTASIFTVAPRGIAILVILLEMPMPSSIHCLLNGMVAELEQVPKAFSAAGRIAFRNFSGLCLPISFYRETIHYNSEAKECHIQNDKLCCKEMIVSVPLASTTGTMVQKNTDGCKVHDGCDDLQAYFIDGINQIQEWSSFSPTAIECETDDQGNTKEPGACFRQQMRRLGWKGSGFSGCQGYCSFL